MVEESRSDREGQSTSTVVGQSGDVLLPDDMKGLKLIYMERKYAIKRNCMFIDLVPGGKRT